jgi:hypothetical protein
MNLRLFIPAALIGAVVGLAIGFTVHKATGELGDFSVWISPTHYFGRPLEALIWMIGGIIVALAAAYLRTANSK